MYSFEASKLIVIFASEALKLTLRISVAIRLHCPSLVCAISYICLYAKDRNSLNVAKAALEVLQHIHKAAPGVVHVGREAVTAPLLDSRLESNEIG